jgi:hypothetical protein
METQVLARGSHDANDALRWRDASSIAACVTSHFAARGA